MSGAAAAVQAALVAALRGHVALMADVSGVFLGPPARAVYPYVAIGGAVSADWSHKTGSGREHRLAVSLWDVDPGRAIVLAGAVESAIEGMARVLDGHRIVSLVLMRSRMLRESRDGPWASIADYRVRTLAE
ncbi:DUF3168 domain-containing protein [Sphingomonas profundi]|uniref:DUF3168 domain-containing protein n=1 Tax=Alterirhizorhabdus profundi TaxID=2681549 RepID=UPI0012E86B20|nr:DUF3168 domain-containing protein [Sphingomonas profundi]